MNKQTGFTLIEISIVLVIIGVLLGVILKTTGIIGGSKTTSTVSLIKDLTGSVADFKSRHHYLPGDLPKASQDISGTVCDGNGNGVVDTQGEVTCATEELVLGGFIKGSTTGIVSPLNNGANPDVFVMAANTATVKAANTFPPTVQNVIEIQNIPCDAAIAVDSKIDDGDPTKGNVRSTVCTNGAATLDVAL